ncbi:hypothetical protein ASG52_19775 [Methylobacterium sp. Leaf456]|uniref:hypothetical protein n=1 Tax=Methylobacterium sp. Leaf456 TaxID=1736382 RepID=UPI0006FE6F0E|nr:hypothetical protein [Methylobacterium sp. Leaf456]KQT59967.1 hypothetical protein ASG52_19775 [Methylobacterium sp. Leaf456]
MTAEFMAGLALAVACAAFVLATVTFFVVSQTHLLDAAERRRPVAANGNTPCPEVYDESASVGGC